jgi:hypothetical protein
MDNRLKQDALIEDALKSYPLTTMPRDITANVMARIQRGVRPAIVTWSDFVLSFVITACITALWFATQNLPPILLAKMRIQSILLYQDFLINAHWLVPMGMVALAAILVTLTIPSLFRRTTDQRR